MTSVRAHLPVYGSLHLFRNSSVRTGIYVGILLSVVFSAWVIVANRAPALENFALVRNLAAVAVLGVLAVIPVLRFWRLPGNLLSSSLVGWLIFSVAYRILSLAFPGLGARYSAVQIFVLGAVVYLLAVTVCWIGTIIRRARASDVHHSNHI
ncbi:MAG TPA: hypothetical protein VJN93_01510 [Candidatus Acidoferrum sp.]|nr:hypothetical protein [Candidatus Acidoferrum sp.]